MGTVITAAPRPTTAVIDRRSQTKNMLLEQWIDTNIIDDVSNMTVEVAASSLIHHCYSRFGLSRITFAERETTFTESLLFELYLDIEQMMNEIWLADSFVLPLVVLLGHNCLIYIVSTPRQGSIERHKLVFDLKRKDSAQRSLHYSISLCTEVECDRGLCIQSPTLLGLSQILENVRRNFVKLSPDIYKRVLSTSNIDVYHAVKGVRKNQQLLFVRGELFSAPYLATVFLYDFKNPSDLHLEAVNRTAKIIVKVKHFMKDIDALVCEHYDLLRTQPEYPSSPSCEFSYTESRKLWGGLSSDRQSSPLREEEGLIAEAEDADGVDVDAVSAKRSKTEDGYQPLQPQKPLGTNTIRSEAFLGEKMYAACVCHFLAEHASSSEESISADDLRANAITWHNALTAVERVVRHCDDFGVRLINMTPDGHRQVYLSHIRYKIWKYYLAYGFEETCATLWPILKAMFTEVQEELTSCAVVYS